MNSTDEHDQMEDVASSVSPPSPPPPPFSGILKMPDKITNISIQDEDCTTRRIGGASVMPSFVNSPSLGGASIMPSFVNCSSPPSFTNMLMHFRATTSTTIAKPVPSPSTTSTEANKSPQTVYLSHAKSQNTNKQTHLKFRWHLPEDKVPTLPEFYRLERTAVFVSIVISPSTVSERISNVLWDLSVESRYDDSDRHKAKVTCVTTDGVDFRIRLFRGKKQYSRGIIVELQRRNRTSINFYNEYTKVILDAAEGKSKPIINPKSLLPEVPRDGDDHNNKKFKPNPRSSLFMISKMLCHCDAYDTQYLAMQNLATLTDAQKVGRFTARCIAKELLLPSNEVGRKIATLIFDFHQENEKEDYDPFGLATIAMTILVNVLVANKNASLDKISSSCSKNSDHDHHLGRVDLLLPVLNQKLRDAENHPRLACIAAKCIEHLITENDSDNDGLHLLREQTNEALEIAVQVGYAKHAELMRQSEICLQRFKKSI